MHQTVLVFLLSNLVFQVANHALAGELKGFRLRQWTTLDGLPQNSIPVLLQTRERYIYAGTLAGLARFDGSRFRIFNPQNTPQFPSHRIVSLAETPDETLWVGTQGAGLVAMRETGIATYNREAGLAGDVINWLYSDSRGDLWICTQTGLSVFDAEKGLIASPKAFRGQTLWSAVEDADGTVWVGGLQGLWYRKADGGAWEEKELPISQDRVGISTLEAGKDGSLWIGLGKNGLLHLKDSDWRHYGAGDGLINNYTNRIMMDQEGILWIAGSGGLAQFDGTEFRHFPVEEGNIWALLEDHEGNIWFGTHGGGMYQMARQPIELVHRAQGLRHDAMQAVFHDSRNRTWMGTYAGGLYLQEGNEIRHFTAAESLLHDIVWSIAEDAQGRIWIGTQAGINLYDSEGRFSQLDLADYNGPVISLFRDRSDQMWIGTAKGLYQWKEDAVINHVTRADGLPGDRIIAFCEDREGRLLVGTSGGLGIGQNGRWQGITLTQGLPENIVRSMFQDSEGTTWLGTYGGGMATLNGNQVTPIRSRNDFPPSTVNWIDEDPDGHLWLSSNEGLFRIAKEEMKAVLEDSDYRPSYQSFGVPEGMATKECNGGFFPNGARDAQGRLWVPTMQGFAIADPQRCRPNPHEPRVVIDSIQVDDRTIDPNHLERSLHFPPQSRSFYFRFSALSFGSLEKRLFRYRLEGQDRDWIEETNKTEVKYTNLSPGEYRFMVKAANQDGVWSSEPTTITFRLRPFFYQTTPFRLTVVSVVLLLGYLLHLFATRRLAQRERHLAQLVASRTHEIEQQKYQLEQANEALIEALQQRSDLMHMVIHDLKNPLSAISGYAQMVHEDADDTEEVKIVADRIQRTSNQMLSMINELLQTERIENDGVRLKIREEPLDALLADWFTEWQVLAARKQQELKLICQDEASVRIDWVRTKEILDNLVSNAIKFSPPQTNISLYLKREDRHALIQVKDEGAGLSPDDMKKLFGKFQKLSARPTGGETSSGLGLYIVKQLVDMQGGSIWAESSHHRGCSFFIKFPLSGSA
ncbi:Histidine kinase domain-containing protein [Sulfidibacter corallicola]|uniref:histidine kinase n=1 Tax=Sulfidibacter corallicola TaxID=2818388 RepID=A0A8A4TDW1_SULCO|nr:sensor histidine kinase [Sulfidibacter corallicola]QTD47750.1 hypothetical protein J3U87_19350 [Sulfidibacter corallicola]